MTGAITAIGKEILNPSEFGWAPDSRYLAVQGDAEQEPPGAARRALHLVDTQSGLTQRILPGWVFNAAGYSYEGGGLAWSPGGEYLAIACSIWAKAEPLITEGRVCLIPVSTER